jgi:hypothetical protein
LFVCLFVYFFPFYYYYLYYKTPLWICPFSYSLLCSFSYSFYVRFLLLCYFQNSPMALSMLICSNKIGFFFWKILFRCYMAHSCLHMVSVCVNMRVHICIHLVSPRFIQHAHTHTHTHTHVSVHGTARMSASKFSFYFIFFNDSAHGTAPMSASKFARRRNSLTDGGGFSNRQGTASNLNQVPTKKMYKHKFCTYRVCTRIS